ncbi:hypothetical protein OCGS_0075 [Oceaniovalibus guishaninsula JLT2003]|uniref:Uncharacterized protein n=1 Tax=Oceaniovalibus guishaninsula JLT2003 TaxID=1231392 RepID=K2HT96_9RHOB|nr:hypothetical protein [Oceaniovalibus guishaninsula]EKE45849.1 hypothetical protein OCGS_0075 [Oceaniovalibus guishaninsula JLT2003]
MPQIARFYVRNTAIGFLWAAIFTGLLFYFNIGNLWHLVTHSDIGVLATFLMVFFNGIVFSGVQNGLAIFAMAEKDDDDDRGLPDYTADPLPVAVGRR